MSWPGPRLRTLDIRPANPKTVASGRGQQRRRPAPSAQRPGPDHERGADQHDEHRQRRPEPRIVAEPVAARPEHQSVALVPDGREEIASRTHGRRDQESLGPVAEIMREDGGDRRHHQHGRGIR